MPNPKNLFRLNNLTKQKTTFNWLDTLPGTTRCPLAPAKRCWNLVDHVASYASMRLTFSLTMWHKNGRNNRQRSIKWLWHASFEAGELSFDIDLSLFVPSAEWCQRKWVWLHAERPQISTIKRPDDHHHNPRPTKTHFQITRPIPRIRKVGETQPLCENWWNNSGLAWLGKTGQNTTLQLCLEVSSKIFRDPTKIGAIYPHFFHSEFKAHIESNEAAFSVTVRY